MQKKPCTSWMICRFWERGRVYIAMMKGQHLHLYPDNAFILLLNGQMTKRKRAMNNNKKKVFWKTLEWYVMMMMMKTRWLKLSECSWSEHVYVKFFGMEYGEKLLSFPQTYTHSMTSLFLSASFVISHKFVTSTFLHTDTHTIDYEWTHNKPIIIHERKKNSFWWKCTRKQCVK